MPILFGIVLFFAGTAIAAEYFESKERTPVYERPSMESKILGYLKPGAKVKIEQKSQRWTRVSFLSKKKVRKGFVRTPEEIPFESRYRVGLGYSYAASNQASRTFTDVDGSQTDISDLTSTDTFLSIFGEYIYSKTLGFRMGFVLRTLNLKGKARYRASVPSSDTPVEIKQEFTSFMAGGKYTFWSPFWVGTFMEFTYATKSQVFHVDAEKPSYFILQPAVGASFFIIDRLWLQPEVKLNAFLNSKPMITGYEGMISLGWEF